MSEVVTAPTPPCRTARSRVFTRELWVDRLTRFPLSGLTPAQFCAIEAVSLPSFYAWKRRLAAEATASATPPSHGVDLGPRLLPVRLQQPAAAIELVLPTGAVLRLPPGCDTAWVRSLVAALGEAPC
jgi:transposase